MMGKNGSPDLFCLESAFLPFGPYGAQFHEFASAT